MLMLRLVKDRPPPDPSSYISTYNPGTQLPPTFRHLQACPHPWRRGVCFKNRPLVGAETNKRTPLYIPWRIETSEFSTPLSAFFRSSSASLSLSRHVPQSSRLDAPFLRPSIDISLASPPISFGLFENSYWRETGPWWGRRQEWGFFWVFWETVGFPIG
ncbi:hypothetical protein GWI33_004626 [Rhynchophorus ferrugineus]|uniref:Uncharacterized protein n=1 Tax=Rhynchophorus ferrugineus TaxID=354439 RepID=A0A834MKL5_RHYFE|nr:hypothetical protein GWI33_004626 [Rhynchophorus ferrugineus]